MVRHESIQDICSYLPGRRLPYFKGFYFLGAAGFYRLKKGLFNISNHKPQSGMKGKGLTFSQSSSNFRKIAPIYQYEVLQNLAYAPTVRSGFPIEFFAAKVSKIRSKFPCKVVNPIQ